MTVEHIIVQIIILALTPIIELDPSQVSLNIHSLDFFYQVLHIVLILGLVLRLMNGLDFLDNFLYFHQNVPLLLSLQY